ncbi:uncharacterized protein LOC119322566 [Triticum dicoccoides]|uniref:uncharacterized protein LOC119322566 n=1 Tax=Triticum dicoccoides TaxID=85692 RepID=UPI00188F1FF9|nr:uncharacterized protein LOC119322566 [Triticum dicoccoides]
MAKLAQSSFALDLLRRLLCAHTAGNAAGGGNANTVRADVAALRRGDGAAARKEEEEGATARSPCIVARLMGLDAMPTPARDQQQTLRRSRSASSAEGWSSPTPCCFGDAPRRRVARTTSASFRDRPTYLRRENDEFLLLSFSPDDDGSDDRDAAGWPRSDDDAESRRGKRTVDGDGAKKQRRGRRRLPRRRRRGDEEAESEHARSRRPAAACGLENSSPVSVLEAGDGQEESSTTTTTSSSSVEEMEHAEPCSPCSDGGETLLAPSQQQQRTRRKLLQANSDNFGGNPRPAAASSSSCVLKCSDRDRRDRRVVNKAEATGRDATGIWRIICRMVEQDICGMQWQTMDNGNIAAEMASEILDQLIWEQTAELVQLTLV